MSGFTTIGKKGSEGIFGNGISPNLGPFGSLETAQLTAAGQGMFVYGINDTQWITSSVGNGALVTSSNSLMSCSSGTSSTGWAEVALSRSLKYRAGQGSVCRLTAIFDTGEENTLQLAGIGNHENGYYFAMSGSHFGILHRERSNVEIRSMTVTLAPAGSTTITVTLGGNSKAVTINPNSSTNQAAYLLSIQNYSNVGSGWNAEAVGSIVYFTSKIPGSITGTYSATGTGFTATTAQVQVGTAPIESFVPQNSWNLDKMDGAGKSGFNVDPHLGNIYQIGYQYLGFGDVTFSIENSETGIFAPCHRIKFANNVLRTNIKNPQMASRWMSINKGTVTNGAVIKGASAANFTEGYVIRNIGPMFSAISVKSSVSTVLIPALTLRTNLVFNGQKCAGEASVFNVSVGTDTGNAAGNRLVTVYIYRGATLTGPTNFTSSDSRSMVSVDTSSTGIDVTNARLLKGFLVAANNSVTLSLIDENFFISAGEYLTVAVKATSAIDNVTSSLSWYEDQ